jgi:hypothetical protein
MDDRANEGEEPVVSGGPEPGESFRARVRACRWAIVLAAIGLALQTVDLALGRVVDFSRGRRPDPTIRALATLIESPGWSWWVGSPITWCTVVASYLLIGKFRSPTWNARAVPLAAMNTVDVGLWLIAHARELGLGESVAQLLPPFSVLRMGLEGLQWLELILFAALCAELGAKLGHPDMETAQHAARASALGGLIVWGLNFAMLLHWATRNFRWVGPRRWMQWHLFHSMALVMLALTAFQATVLCLTAARRCRDWLRRQDAADPADLLTPQVDPYFDEWKARDRDAWS